MRTRVLLITPQFYGVEKEIKSVLENSGCEVIWVENKECPFDYHGTRSKLKLLRRLYFFFFTPKTRYIQNEFKKIKDLEFDILFSINAHCVCPFLFRKLKRANPRFHSILYLWDSFEMYNWKTEIRLFDKVYSFDQKDSKNFNMEYKPNFYIRPVNFNSTNITSFDMPEYDLSFVGKFNRVRLRILDSLERLTESQPLRTFLKVYPAYKISPHSKIIYKFLKSFNFRNAWTINYTINYEAIEGILKREYLLNGSMSYMEMQMHLSNSNVILDLPYELQTGYSHRVVDALANGRKLITTNLNIINEKFFDPDQIHILDFANPEFDFQWIKEKKSYDNSGYFAGLELSEWLKSILNVANS
jgi:hypothetical protein